MPYIKRTTYAGKTIRVDKYYSSRYGKQIQRGPRAESTDEAQQERNRQNAIRRLNALLNCNFEDGDFHVVFTYRQDDRPKSADEAKKAYGELMKKLKKAYTKAGFEFKYIAVTEYESKSIHHHLILKKVDTGVILKCWKRGKAHITILDTDGEYYKLAEYLVKETDRTAKKKGGLFKKRWNASKGLKQPIIVREIIEAKNFKKDPKIKKGYYLSKNIDFEINSYDDYGMPKQSYIMIRRE